MNNHNFISVDFNAHLRSMHLNLKSKGHDMFRQKIKFLIYNMRSLVDNHVNMVIFMRWSNWTMRVTKEAVENSVYFNRIIPVWADLRVCPGQPQLDSKSALQRVLREGLPLHHVIIV